MGRIGYSSVTLTDLTETIPVTLVLETNLPQNIQTKVGNLYTPNFSKKEKELIITPSLFRGKEEIYFREHPEYLKPGNRITGFLYYEIGSTVYTWTGKYTGTYVDDEGRLHYNSNLSGNIMIEAYIKDFEDIVHNYTLDLVQVTNPISILFLEEGNDNYFATIECEGGREHFEDTNANAITMTAKLYQGLTNLLETRPTDFEIKWDRLSDGDNKADSTATQLTVERSKVTNRELFTCEIKDKSTGITYTAQQFIYDFTDQYNCVITYDKPLLLSEENTEVNLSAAVWYKNERLEGKTGYKLSYRWMVVGEKDGEDKNLSGNKSTIKISSNDNNIPQKQAFTVLCQVLHTDSAGSQYIIANGVVTFQWIPSYSMRITPKDIFVVTGSDGSYQGNASKQYTFNFQLIDKQGKLIDYDTSDKQPESITADEAQDETKITFSGPKNNKWDFTGTITLSNALWNSTDGSRAYEFTYVYYGQQFTEEINVIKNKTGAQGIQGIQGIQGNQGFSGYTVDLSNEFYAFAGGEGQADADQSTECLVSAYYGSTDLTIKQINLGTLNGTVIYSSSVSNSTVNYSGKNLFVSASASTGKKVKIVIRTNISTNNNEKSLFLRDIVPIPFYVTITDQNGQTVTFSKTFTYTINYNGKSYSLMPSANDIIYNEIQKTFTPNQITVSATARQTSGEAIAYSEGKILYSFDGTNWKIYSNSISGFNGITNIYLRLYGKNASFSNPPTAAEITNAAKYLFDIETIPIITSTEGYQIGGENLLKWSKEMPVEINKWSQNGAATKEKDGEFGVFKLSSAASSIYAPMIPFKEEMINNHLTFSCYLKVADWSKFGGVTFVFCINENFIYNGTIRQTSGEVYLGSSGFNHPSKHGKATIERINNKWCKFTWTFKIVDGHPNNGGFFEYPSSGAISVNQAKYCTIGIIETGSDPGSGIQVKKMKLEYGNVSTEWSASPYDISYLDITGANLGDTTQGIYYRITNTESPKIFAGGLPAGTYTFSFNSSSWSGPSTISTFLCKLFKKSGTSELAISGGEFSFSNNTTLANQKTFTIKDSDLGNDELAFLRIYANSSTATLSSSATLTLKSAKLEKGFSATSFTLEGEYLENYLNALSKADTDQNQLINIYTNEGKIVSTVNGLSSTINTLSSSYVTIDSFKGRLEAASEEVYNLSSNLTELGTLKNAVKVVTKSSEGGPYVQIQQVDSNNTGTSFSAIRITNNQLGFYSADPSSSEPVAYINSSKLSINSAEFIKSFSIGSLEVSITESGVGFKWP